MKKKHGHQHAPHQKGHRRPAFFNSGPPVPRDTTPTQPDRGLSSVLNRSFVVRILQRSSRQEIEGALRESGYTLSAVGLGRSAVDDAVERAAEKFLQTDFGRRRLQDKIQELLRETARREIDAPRGREELERIKAAILGDELSADKDLFAKACQSAIAKQVQLWLDSPHGQATLEAEQARVARRQAGGTPRPSGKWVQRPLPETNGADHVE